jgi:hypothetical protein
MTTRGLTLALAILLGSTLTACVDATPSPTSSASPTATTTASPSASPTPSETATSSPSPTTPPASDPPPQRVEGLTAETGGGSGEVLLRWDQNPEPDVVSYVVLKATTPGGSQVRIGTVSREEVTEFEYVPFVDSEATVGYYRVRAVDSGGQEGPKSAEVCGASVGHSC